MFSRLQNHPFGVEAFFGSSVVLAFAVEKEELQPMLPGRLELDLFDDKWAFIAAAMVDTSALRPKGFPAWMGRSFFLIGYRIFVRYRTRGGKRLRGLYIIRSETDRFPMKFFGNLFTHYNYRQTDVSVQVAGTRRTIASRRSDFLVEIDESTTDVPLPAGSPFPSWKEARRFAGPLPFTFTYNAARDEMLIIEGVRSNWDPKPVQVLQHHSAFIDNLSLKNVLLANAFVVHDIPYYWKKGRLEKW